MSHTDEHHGHHDHEHPGHGHDDPHDEEHRHSSHDHGHGHGHGVSVHADFKKLSIGLTLILGFMLVEVIVGILAHSLALLSDAGHMLTDAGALLLSMVALKLSQRPATSLMTYGFKRTGVLSALINGTTMVLLGGFITYEAIWRLVYPPTVQGNLMFWVAIIGMVVNLIALWVLAKANRESLNMRGSFAHIATDLGAFIATAIAAAIIWMTGFNRADPIMSLLVAASMFYAGIPLVKASCRVFLQMAPDGVNPDAIRGEILAIRGIVAINNLHMWTVDGSSIEVTVRAVVVNEANCDWVQDQISHIFGQDHRFRPTIQVDREHEGLTPHHY